MSALVVLQIVLAGQIASAQAPTVPEAEQILHFNSLTYGVRMEVWW